MDDDIFDPRVLAHCKMCYEPMYCIYDQSIRDFCYECEIENAIMPAAHK